MSIVGLAAVPAAPALVPGVGVGPPGPLAGELERCRATLDRTLGRLGEAIDTIVLLACSQGPALHDAARATLASYGHPQVEASLTIDTHLLAQVGARGQAPRVLGERLDGDLAVLALQLARISPGTPVLPVGVSSGAAPDACQAVAAGLHAAAGAVGSRVAVVAAGDLSAARAERSPGWMVEGAVVWDEAVADAVRRGDRDALAGLGPDEAARVGARGWAPLLVLLELAVAAGATLGEVELAAPLGVGQLSAVGSVIDLTVAGPAAADPR